MSLQFNDTCMPHMVGSTQSKHKNRNIWPAQTNVGMLVCQVEEYQEEVACTLEIIQKFVLPRLEIYEAALYNAHEIVLYSSPRVLSL